MCVHDSSLRLDVLTEHRPTWVGRSDRRTDTAGRAATVRRSKISSTSFTSSDSLICTSWHSRRSADVKKSISQPFSSATCHLSQRTWLISLPRHFISPYVLWPCVCLSVCSSFCHKSEVCCQKCQTVRQRETVSARLLTIRASWLISASLRKARLRRTISYCYWQLFLEADDALIRKILYNETHVLHSLVCQIS